MKSHIERGHVLKTVAQLFSKLRELEIKFEYIWQKLFRLGTKIHFPKCRILLTLEILEVFMHSEPNWQYYSEVAFLFPIYPYNIPRACLLNRSPVPAMDLKSNRSGLWRHMLDTCRRLRRLCRKHSNNVARHDKTPVKPTLLSREMSFMSRRSDIMLWLLYIQKLQSMHFQFDYLCSVATYDIIFCCRPVYYKTLILRNSLWLVFSIQNLARRVTSFSWFQNSVDQAVS